MYISYRAVQESLIFYVPHLLRRANLEGICYGRAYKSYANGDNSNIILTNDLKHRDVRLLARSVFPPQPHLLMYYTALPASILQPILR